MFRLGEKQTLKAVKKVDFGMYLADPDDGEVGGLDSRVLLPAKQVPDYLRAGEPIEVFLYKDSEDRMIATTNEPKITLHSVARLTVLSVTKIGAFLDWGLEKDLLLPYAQQTGRLREGDEIPVALYIDKSNRLAATMKIYPYLSTESPYKEGDDVEGTAYELKDRFGLFVAVDDMYSAIIPKTELFGDVIREGSRIRARVTKVREDGRLNLSVREKAYLQMEPDMEKIMELLDSYDGVLPFTEKADPEVIKRETGMSKNEFKRAVGHLYKERKIKIENGKISLI